MHVFLNLHNNNILCAVQYICLCFSISCYCGAQFLVCLKHTGMNTNTLMHYLCSVMSWLLHCFLLHNLHCHLLLLPTCMAQLFIYIPSKNMHCLPAIIWVIYFYLYVWFINLLLNPLWKRATHPACMRWRTENFSAYFGVKIACFLYTIIDKWC